MRLSVESDSLYLQKQYNKLDDIVKNYLKLLTVKLYFGIISTARGGRRRRKAALKGKESCKNT